MQIAFFLVIGVLSAERRKQCSGSEIIFSDPDPTLQEISDPDPISDPAPISDQPGLIFNAINLKISQLIGFIVVYNL